MRLPELNSGFEPVWWYQDEEIARLEMGEDGCRNEDGGVRQECGGRSLPALFKADVKEEGNYRVRATFTACGKEEEEILLFLGRRHLAWKGRLRGGQRQSVEALVNVSANRAPGKNGSVSGYHGGRSSCGPGRGSDGAFDRAGHVSHAVYRRGFHGYGSERRLSYAPGASYSGWGQMLSAFLKDGIAVSNHAHSGLTTESFREEGHYAILYDRLKAGDYVLLQFGHNDQKLDHLKAEEGYRENLDRYLSEIRKKGAYPILVTPIARNTWKGLDGTYNDLLADYAEAVKRLGRERKVPVIDLHAAGKAFVMIRGLEEAKSWFFPQ